MAEKIELNSGAKATAFIQGVLNSLASDIAKNLADAIPKQRQPSSNAVHELRISLRRLEAALLAFKPAIKNQAQVGKLRSQAKTLLKALQPRRDLAVYRELLQDIASENPATEASVKALLTEMSARESRSKETLTAALTGEAAKGLPNAISGLATSVEVSGKQAKRLIRELHQLNSKYWVAIKKQAKRKKFADSKPRALHKVRIRVKRAKYLCELLRDLKGFHVERRVADYARLQDVLGGFNDLVQLRAFVKLARLVPRVAKVTADGLVLSTIKAKLAEQRSAIRSTRKIFG